MTSASPSTIAVAARRLARHASRRLATRAARTLSRSARGAPMATATAASESQGARRPDGTLLSSAVDVVVIGSGFAGLAAAIEAATLAPSASVLVLEKMSQAGGNSQWNAGQVAAVGSILQAAAGIQDSAQSMIDDMLAAGEGLNHVKLVETLVHESNATAEWTMSALGVQYRDRLSHMGGHSVPRTLCTVNSSGRDLIDPMLSKIDALPNVSLALDTAVEGLALDGKRVVGVHMRPRGEESARLVLCAKGVVLAAGGFGADVAFRAIQNPMFGDKAMTTNHSGATSETLRAALRAGAMPVQLSRIQLGPWTSPDERGFGMAPMFCIGAGFPYGIIVDPATSQRFVNEMGNRFQRSQAILQRGHPAVCIADAAGAQHSLEKNLERLAPAVQTHNSLDELAGAYSMDAAVLRQTIDDYNAGVKLRRDVLGKTLREDAKPIAEFPLYSVRLWPKVHHCCGGVQINHNAQVMHIDGDPMLGLYAAGEFVGGVHGADRLGSCATTECLVFGRRAGRHAVLGGPSTQ